VLKGMDFVMDECHKRGLKIIWVLADNWCAVASKGGAHICCC
jgi:hypothetical protein